MSWAKDGIQNATITDATLDVQDRGVLIGTVGFTYGGGLHQGLGGHCLEGEGHGNYCARWIRGILDAAGAGRWSDLKGKNVRVEIENGLISRVGHIVDDTWFDPKEAVEVPA